MFRSTRILSLLLFLSTINFSLAQSDSITDRLEFNIQNYTPSSLLKKNQIEVKIFNNLYTDNSGYNDDGYLINNSRRQTYFTSFIQSSYGVNQKFNIGIDAQIKSVRIDNNLDSSPLELFTFKQDAQNRTALSYIGPKIKFSPIKKRGSFSIQSTFFIPIAKDQQGVENGKPWLSHDGFQWWTQLFYDQKISTKFRAFFELDAFIGIDRKLNKDNNSILTPAKVFLSYFPSKKTTIYTMAEFGPSWGKGQINTYYTQFGIGAKYQIIKNLEIELLYSKFPIGKNSGAGTTYNIGIRYLK